MRGISDSGAEAQFVRATRFWASLSPHTDGFYVNDMAGGVTPEAVAANYGVNFPRLAALKVRYDAGDHFRLNASIRRNWRESRTIRQANPTCSLRHRPGLNPGDSLRPRTGRGLQMRHKRSNQDRRPGRTSRCSRSPNCVVRARPGSVTCGETRKMLPTYKADSAVPSPTAA